MVLTESIASESDPVTKAQMRGVLSRVYSLLEEKNKAFEIAFDALEDLGRSRPKESVAFLAANIVELIWQSFLAYTIRLVIPLTAKKRERLTVELKLALDLRVQSTHITKGVFYAAFIIRVMTLSAILGARKNRTMIINHGILFTAIFGFNRMSLRLLEMISRPDASLDRLADIDRRYLRAAGLAYNSQYNAARTEFENLLRYDEAWLDGVKTKAIRQFLVGIALQEGNLTSIYKFRNIMRPRESDSDYAFVRAFFDFIDASKEGDSNSKVVQRILRSFMQERFIKASDIELGKDVLLLKINEIQKQYNNELRLADLKSMKIIAKSPMFGILGHVIWYLFQFGLFQIEKVRHHEDSVVGDQAKDDLTWLLGIFKKCCYRENVKAKYLELRGAFSWCLKKPSAARQDLRMARSIAQIYQDVWVLILSDRFEALILRDEGRLDEAIDMASEAIMIAEKSGLNYLARDIAVEFGIERDRLRKALA